MSTHCNHRTNEAARSFERGTRQGTNYTAETFRLPVVELNFWSQTLDVTRTDQVFCLNWPAVWSFADMLS